MLLQRKRQINPRLVVAVGLFDAYIEEVQAPRFYSLNNRPMDVTIEFATQIIRLEFANASANVGVSVTKTGPQTVMPGQNHVVYEIRRLRNDSTVPHYMTSSSVKSSQQTLLE